MARFTLPRDIYYGSGAIDELKNLKRLQKGNDPHRWQFYETGRFFAEGRRYPA